MTGWEILGLVVLAIIGCISRALSYHKRKDSSETEETETPREDNRSNDHKKLLQWGAGIVALVALAIFIPSAWRNPVLLNGSFWLAVATVLVFVIFNAVLSPGDWEEGVKRKSKIVANLLFALALLGQAYVFAQSKDLAPSWQGVSGELRSLTAPAPKPEVVWRGQETVTAPAGISWDKAPKVKLPYLISAVQMVGVGESEDGFFEILAEGWNAPKTGGGTGKYTLPTLPAGRTFRVRSVEKKPLTIVVRWR